MSKFLTRQRFLIGSGALVGALLTNTEALLGMSASRALLSDRIRLGTGTLLSMWNTPRTGQWVDARQGTIASPDVGAGALIKASRTIGHTQSQLTQITGSSGADGSDELSALQGMCVATNGSQVQSVGVNGGAKNSGTSGSPDACGVYGTGHIQGSGVGVALGGFFSARRDNASASATGVELHVANYSGVGTNYNPTGWDKCHAMWITASGNAPVSTGILFGRLNGLQTFDVGIGIIGGTDNAITGASFRDDGTAARSLFIKGTHSQAAIEVGSGSGNVVLGDACNIVAGTNTGTKIGTAPTQKIGLFGADPVPQPQGYSPPYDLATLNKLVEDLKGLGLIAA